MTAPVLLRKPSSGREVFVVVGAGQAGCQAVSTLRERGFRGRVVLVGDERQRPYMRPPLSKKFLAGQIPEERLYLRPASFFDENDVELMLDTSVDHIDLAAQRVDLNNGLRLAYDKLLIATGSRPRALHLPGSGLCHYLNSLDDAIRLRSLIQPNSRIAVVGGGYIGLEVAATAAQTGARVTVIEIAQQILNRVTTSALASFVEQTHRAHGVEIACNSRVIAFDGGAKLEAVVCEDRRIEADFAIVGIGAVPNVELAQLAGLACSDGIIVDEHCRTSNGNVYAAGDCASFPHRHSRRRLRLESVQNAVDQATVAANNMCGNDEAYDRVPWFWSNQYDLKLQSAGLFEGHDEIQERGNRAAGSFALLYRKGGALIAVDAVNMPGEYLAARKQIGDGGAVPPRKGGRVGERAA